MEKGIANIGSGPNSLVSSGLELLDIGVRFSEPIVGDMGELGKGALSFLINSLKP